MTKQQPNTVRKRLSVPGDATMSEIALITAIIGLLLALGAILLDRATSIRLERVAELLRALDSVLGRATDEIAKINTELPEARVIEVEGVCRRLKEQYDAVVTEVEQHRAGVHRSIQRFDQIMRRDERAAAVIEGAQKEEDEGLDVDLEGEEIPKTQEGDRSFLRTREEVSEPVNGGTWEQRRRAMSQQYHANRGGQFVRSGPTGVPRE